jgi:hypothetical protein
VDAAVADIVSTINQNADYVNSLVTSGTLSPIPPDFLYRQAIINGNFDIWQRGTSFSNPTDNSYTADRWQVRYDGSGVGLTVSRQALSPGELEGKSKYFCRYAVTAPGTGNTQHQFAQRIEGVNLFNGQKVTISFFAKADAPRAIKCAIDQVFGDGGSPTEYNAGGLSPEIVLSTAWQRYSYTVTLPSISGKVIGPNDHLRLLFALPADTTFVIDIAQVQLCAGDVALPFQPRTVGEELVLCRRYCRVYGVGVPGVAVSSTGAVLFVSDLHMRVAPSVRQLKTSFDIFDGGGIISTSSGTLSYGIMDAGGYTVNAGGFTGLTQYRPIVLNTPDVFILDAEL